MLTCAPVPTQDLAAGLGATGHVAPIGPSCARGVTGADANIVLRRWSRGASDALAALDDAERLD